MDRRDFMGALLGALLAPIAGWLSRWFPSAAPPRATIPRVRFQFSKAPMFSVKAEDIPGYDRDCRENVYDLTVGGDAQRVSGEHVSMSSNQVYGYWQPRLEGLIMRGVKA